MIIFFAVGPNTLSGRDVSTRIGCTIVKDTITMHFTVFERRLVFKTPRRGLESAQLTFFIVAITLSLHWSLCSAPLRFQLKDRKAEYGFHGKLFKLSGVFTFRSTEGDGKKWHNVFYFSSNFFLHNFHTSKTKNLP